MEKITLKPIAREILHPASEPGLLFDVMTASGSGQERPLGSLYVLSHLKQPGDALSYVVSLVSSLARREFYSPQSVAEQEPKAAFERTLKKLNEVLEDFFKNQDFTLQLGLAAISGSQIYLSRLGKFKVALARNGEYIDILNNVALFNQDDRDENQFSNIVSGRLLPGDKIFAYFPVRCLTSREKALNPLFLSQDQTAFTEKLANLASTTNNFACCGVHIQMQEIKEIPLPAADSAVAPAVLARSEGKAATGTLRSEVSFAKRTNLLHQLAQKYQRISFKRPLWGAIVALMVVTGGWYLVGGISSASKAAYNQANQNFKLAQTKLGQNDTGSARSLLAAAIGQLANFTDKNTTALKASIVQALDSIDHVSDHVPTLVTDPVDPVKIFPPLVPTALRSAIGDQPIALYEDNLYALDGTTIYKYADALKGGTKRSAWGKLESSAWSIAVDGNLYALGSDGTLATYFKGKKTNTASLGLIPSAGSTLYTDKSAAALYLTDLAAKRLYVFDKTTGELKITYKLTIAGTPQAVRIGSDGVIWILASDNKVWQIKP